MESRRAINIIVIGLVISVLASNISLPDGDQRYYGNAHETINSLIFYVSMYCFMIASFSLLVIYSKGNLMYKAILFLLFGKLLDCFTSLFSYAFPEFVIDFLVGCFVIKNLSSKKNKAT